MIAAHGCPTFKNIRIGDFRKSEYLTYLICEFPKIRIHQISDFGMSEHPNTLNTLSILNILNIVKICLNVFEVTGWILRTQQRQAHTTLSIDTKRSLR